MNSPPRTCRSVGVGLRLAGLGDQRAQETVADQLPDADLVADVVQESVRRADRARLQAERRGREPDDPQRRVDHLGVRQELAVHPLAFGRDQMGLVDHHQVEGVELAGPA